MKYILFDKSAVEHLINSRFFQTAEYTEGKNLASFLKGDVDTLDPIEGIYSSSSEEGAIFLGKESSKVYLIFDLQQSKILDNKNIEEIIQILQKTFRFSIKYWNKMFFNPSELVLTDSNKAVIFPFPYSKGSSFRIVLEREPDAQRTLKRGIKQTLLVYKAGNEGTPTQVERPSLSIFREAIESVNSMTSKANIFFKKNEVENNLIKGIDLPVNLLEVRDDSESQLRSGTQFISYAEWQKILTNKQKDFINRPVQDHPMRLEGPAGTGKTMTLILKAYHLLEQAKKNKQECNILFLAHSKATQIAIKNIFQAVSMGNWLETEQSAFQSIEVVTLHEYCIDTLITNIHSSEVIERDALSSKELQYYAISEAVGIVKQEKYQTYRPFLSESIRNLLDNYDSNQNVVCSMLQHEFSVMIKGKSSSDLEKYKKLSSLPTGLQVITEKDKIFVYQIFNAYQEQFERTSQFDTDDIILTAIGRLDSPLWRRRRKQEGYDYIFIDETHLFNQNETMIFHYLTKNESKYPFIFSIDVSQAIGDRGEETTEFLESYNSTNQLYKEEYDLVFRSSQAITNLAMSITASGAILFGNFKNPYKNSSSAFTNAEENLSKIPEYILKKDDEEILSSAIKLAEDMSNSMRCSPSEIAIISFSEILHHDLQKQMGDKPFITIEKRGDLESKVRAKETKAFVLSLPDYVGGMEFNGVILIGVDAARVPSLASDDISKNYLSFSAYNKLYVSITRAKYQVIILGTDTKGVSSCLEYSLEQKTIQRK